MRQDYRYTYVRGLIITRHVRALVERDEEAAVRRLVKYREVARLTLANTREHVRAVWVSHLLCVGAILQLVRIAHNYIK